MRFRGDALLLEDGVEGYAGRTVLVWGHLDCASDRSSQMEQPLKRVNAGKDGLTSLANCAAAHPGRRQRRSNRDKEHVWVTDGFVTVRSDGHGQRRQRVARSAADAREAAEVNALCPRVPQPGAGVLVANELQRGHSPVHVRHTSAIGLGEEFSR
jgi:hypothetical protein